MSRTVKSPDERRQELLNIGIQLFLQQGSAGVTIQRVIARANVATGLFYYYFASKEDFLDQAITGYVARLSDQLIGLLTQADDNALARMKMAVSKVVAHFGEVRPVMHDEAMATPQFDRIAQGLLQKLTPAMEALILKGASQGVFQVGSPALAAGFILSGLMGVLHAGQGTLSKEATGQEINRLVFGALGVDVG